LKGELMKPEEMLEIVKQRLTVIHWNYSFKPHDWFFPNDVAPHSNSFKYKCKKLYSLRMLERQGDNTNRWGYQYRVPVESDIKL